MRNDYHSNTLDGAEAFERFYAPKNDIGDPTISELISEPDYFEFDEDEDDFDDNDECCDDCGCYHGHHPWCNESDEQDDW